MNILSLQIRPKPIWFPTLKPSPTVAVAVNVKSSFGPISWNAIIIPSSLPAILPLLFLTTISNVVASFWIASWFGWLSSVIPLTPEPNAIASHGEESFQIAGTGLFQTPSLNLAQPAFLVSIDALGSVISPTFDASEILDALMSLAII